MFDFSGIYNLCPEDKIPKGLPKIDYTIYTEWGYDYMFGGKCLQNNLPIFLTKILITISSNTTNQ